MAESNEISNFLSETYNETKRFFLERLSSPLIASFTISWIITNYQFVLIIFSEVTINHKLNLLNNYFHKEYMFFGQTYLSVPSWILFGFIVPSLAAYVYVFQYPKIGDKFYIKALRSRINLKNQRIDEEKLAYSTPEKVEEIHKYYKKVQEELNIKLKELENSKEALESVLESQRNEKQEEEEESGDSNDELETKLSMAKAYIDMGDKVGANELLAEIITKGNPSIRRRAKTQLKKLLNNLSKSSAEDEKNTANKSIELNPDELIVVTVLGKLNDSGRSAATEADMKKLATLSNSRLEIALQDLFTSKLVNKQTDKMGTSIYYLTNAGLRQYVMLQK